MKRLLFAVSAAVLLLNLVACSQSEPVITDPASEVPVTTAAPTQPQKKDPQLGEFADGVYTNDFVGICCQVDENWSVYSDAQLAQLNGLVLGTMTDADLVEQLKKANVGHLFYATSEEGHKSMNVVLENIGVINGVLLDEQAYVDLSVEQLPAALISMGLVNVKAETTKLQFAGAEHAAVQVRGELAGVSFFEKIVCIKVGNYFGIVTVASYHEDATDALLELFSAA